MTYHSGFVLSVKDSNQHILRESGGKVHLNFYSEYSLLIKNNNDVRALASVRIDGTDILGGHRLIIPAWGSVVLDRFMLDGNLSSGKRLKFVPLSDSEVQDPTSGDNGCIEVELVRELDWRSGHVMQPTILRNSGSPCLDSFTTYSAEIGHSGPVQATNCCFSASTGFENTLSKPKAAFVGQAQVMPDSFSAGGERGATVEGSKSGQKFQQASGFVVDQQCTPTILRLQLVSSAAPVTVQETRTVHCTGCGNKMKFKDHFCGSCGQKTGR